MKIEAMGDDKMQNSRKDSEKNEMLMFLRNDCDRAIIKELELLTNVRLENLLKSEVPTITIRVAIRYLSIEHLFDLVTCVSFNKLVKGLKIVKVSQIQDIPHDKLRIILEDGDMNILEKINATYEPGYVTQAVLNLSPQTLRTVMRMYDEEELQSLIENYM